MRIFKRKELVSAQNLVNGYLKKVGFDPERYAAFDVWDSLLGNMASHARAVGIRGGKIHVEVDSSVHLQELTLRKKEILRKLNGYLGRQKIKDVLFKIGEG